jgi:homeobox protein cut-like
MGEGFRVELDRVKGLNERLEADLARVNGSGGEAAGAEKGLAGLDIGRSVRLSALTNYVF